MKKQRKKKKKKKQLPPPTLSFFGQYVGYRGIELLALRMIVQILKSLYINYINDIYQCIDITKIKYSVESL